jgi:hypothetical protein
MPLSVWDDEGLKFWALAWGTFDRDGLKAALIAAGAPLVNEEILVRAAGWICRAWSHFGTGKQVTAPASKKLRNLHKALSEWSEWLDDPQWINSWEGFLLSDGPSRLPVWLGGEGPDMSIVEEITRLTQKVDRVIKTLESRDRQPQGKQEHPLTTFFVSLCDLYTIISGKTSLTDDGPGHRFVKECAALVDPSIIVPERGFRQLVQTARRRREGSTTCKNGPTK